MTLIVKALVNHVAITPALPIPRLITLENRFSAEYSPYLTVCVTISHKYYEIRKLLGMHPL
jgi:hypothetical protein